MNVKWIGGLIYTLMVDITECSEGTCLDKTCPTESNNFATERAESDENHPHMFSSATGACAESERRLVLYEESKLFPHQTKQKIFDFAGEEITILQDWTNVGVAGVVWDAAVTLSEYLQENPTVVKDKRVIELGAGTGLVGMVAGLLGASHVDITDRELALEQLSENVNRNVKGKCDTRVNVAELDWGVNHDKYSTYDIVLGADIVYIEETFPELLKTLNHLSSCSTTVILSCRIRYDRDRDFIALLKRTFSVEVILKDEKRNNLIYRCNKLC